MIMKMDQMKSVTEFTSPQKYQKYKTDRNKDNSTG